ncbi:MAG TPA: N-acetylmannosamine-6-phosphate 2-epimerase [Beutenbergiaceae bacterium]|nr:N-acetylmannosamine-6-phosphate 2-epimerase [Beutenbergiaceae bacterium]
MHPVIEAIRGGLIVSCQAYPGEPMRDPGTTAQVARSVVAGGAVAVRTQGLADIRAVHQAVDVPVIGIWKDGSEGVFITPTLEHAQAVADAGAHVVALDGTTRPRPDGLTLAQTVRGLRQHHQVVVMADCGSVPDALAAQQAGVDLIGTTLAGYTGARAKTAGPDLAFISELLRQCQLPVVAEGRVHTTQQAAAAMDRGAFAVCVGTAITHPSTITSWFREAIAGG